VGDLADPVRDVADRVARGKGDKEAVAAGIGTPLTPRVVAAVEMAAKAVAAASAVEVAAKAVVAASAVEVAARVEAVEVAARVGAAVRVEAVKTAADVGIASS
jgi:hypothetical protein